MTSIHISMKRCYLCSTVNNTNFNLTAQIGVCITCGDPLVVNLNKTNNNTNTNKKQRCPICKDNYEGIGYNSEPLSYDRCCEDCYNRVIVLYH